MTYEWGPANLNRALGESCRKELADLEPRSTAVDKCLEGFARFVTSNEEALEHGSRFSLSLQHVDVEEETFDLPDGALSGLRYAGASKWSGTLSASRLFRPGEGEEPIRADLKVDFEQIDDDPMRHRDRWLASLTLARKFGGVSVPFGLVYANHGEFLPEVDEQLSAHLGIKFDLFGSQEEPKEP